ncbi:MAG TPA: hypothetical protein VF134_05365, partial [Candidatus Dormibacteraeota bacterium]
MGSVRAYVLLLGVLGIVIATPSPASAVDISVGQAQQQLNQAQARLGQLNDQVEHAQGQLDLAARTLAEDQVVESRLDTELAALARYQYTEPALPIRLFRAGSFSAALAEITQARIVGSRQQALLAKQQRVRARDQQARDQIAAELKSIQQAQKQAETVVAQAQATLDAAKAEEVRRQAAALEVQARSTVVGSASSMSGSVGNHFSYGYCTWYVAN